MGQITEYLTNAIVEGQLIGGERLVENELQRRFGVSRAPIRESFRILEKNGFLVTYQRKGTYVRKITKKEIVEHFPIRGVLEGFAARLAIPHQKPEDIEGMELALAGMTEAAEKNDPKSYSKSHGLYHRILIHTCKNDTLIELITNLRHRAVWFWFSALYVQQSFEYAIRVHREILDLFINKDADQLETVVKEHILYAVDKYLMYLSTIIEGEKAVNL